MYLKNCLTFQGCSYLIYKMEELVGGVLSWVPVKGKKMPYGILMILMASCSSAFWIILSPYILL